MEKTVIISFFKSSQLILQGFLRLVCLPGCIFNSDNIKRSQNFNFNYNCFFLTTSSFINKILFYCFNLFMKNFSNYKVSNIPFKQAAGNQAISSAEKWTSFLR